MLKGKEKEYYVSNDTQKSILFKNKNLLCPTFGLYKNSMN